MKDVTMTPELFWLTLSAALSVLIWVPYVVNRFAELGLPGMGWFPPVDPPHRAEWANRGARAQGNAVEAMIAFAPLAITTHLVGGTSATALACMIFFYARLAHWLIMLIGMPIPLRTMAFLIGVGCQLVLVASLLSR